MGEWDGSDRAERGTHRSTLGPQRRQEPTAPASPLPPALTPRRTRRLPDRHPRWTTTTSALPHGTARNNAWLKWHTAEPNLRSLSPVLHQGKIVRPKSGPTEHDERWEALSGADRLSAGKTADPYHWGRSRCRDALW